MHIEKKPNQQRSFLKGKVAKRFKRKGASDAASLASEDIEYLKNNTRYTETEIKEWFRLLTNLFNAIGVYKVF